jgi:excisionase family DNA binding protein
MMADRDQRLYLNVQEAAEALDVHPNTLRNWVQSGTIVSSRVPGSRVHRFAREEVSRLQKERGAVASSVAPALQTGRSELVTATELDTWASSLDARSTFPELMRRLLDGTPGVSDVDVRAHEGTSAQGWDGVATSLQSKYLPDGRLVMEFGTNGDIKRKANEDYEYRVRSLAGDADSVFVFATPRNWPGGAQWAAKRTKEHHFLEVKVVDAHVLEGWLQATAPAHYWISEHLGYRPRDAQTLSGWWANFHERTRPSLPPEFFAAGREEQARELVQSLSGASAPQVTTLQANWKDEALAFLFAALANRKSLVSRTVLVNDKSVWDRLTESRVPLLLIPLFDNQGTKLDIALAIERGHQVLLLASGDDAIREGTAIALPKVDRVKASEILRTVLPEMKEVDAFVARARRSMGAAVRSISRDPRITAPDWLTRSDLAGLLLPLIFAERWTALEGDTEAIERLTGRKRDEVEITLASLASRPDAPFVLSGGIWRPASPMEAALLLLPKLTSATALRWKEVVLQVLLAVDPFEGLGTVERITRSALGTRPMYSEILRGGLARGLALCGASDVSLSDGNTVQGYVDDIVRSLFRAAEDDPTAANWHRLSSVLPSLAEASPEIFQDAIERDLESDAPILQKLFDAPAEDDFFGGRSAHVGLVLALETLSWEPNYFGRVGRILGDLTHLDPGGKSHTRPIESLQKICLGWTSQSGASTDAKIGVVRALIDRVPQAGWTLARMLWPTSHGFATTPHLPEFRDWSIPRSGVMTADWLRFIHELVAVVIATADTKADRWAEIAPEIDQLPLLDRQVVLERLSLVIAEQVWTDEERYVVWAALIEEVRRHEEFSDAEWAMPASEINALRHIVSELAPGEDPRQFASFFDWRASVPGFRLGDDGYDAELRRLQERAIEAAISMGAKGLTSLTLEAKTPFVIGELLAGLRDFDNHEILGWLASDESNLRQASRAYAIEELRTHGIGWLHRTLAGRELVNPAARTELMGALAAQGEFWDQLEGLDPDLQQDYWRMFNAYQVAPERRGEATSLLVKRRRPWAAAAVVTNMLKSDYAPSIELIGEVLRAVIAYTGGAEDPTMAGYYIGEILGYVEHHDPENSELPQFEFIMFELLHDHQPSRALYKSLGNDPTDFVEMLKSLFRSEGEPQRTTTAKEQAFAHLSYSVLREWASVPGQREDGTIDSDHLTSWVRSARLALADAGRAAIGDEQIGQVLSGSPEGADGLWPAEPIRELIENIGNTRIDTGVHIGLMNRRGVTSRDVYDGGRQERDLESRYRTMASKASVKWPRTARILRGIADDFQQQARMNDAESERWADEG